MPPTLTALLASPRALGPLVTPGDLGCSSASWQVLCRDGDVTEVRPGFALLAGLPETAAVRAQTLVPSVPRALVVARSWAVWVHAGGAPPGEGRRICVVYRPSTSRPRSTPGLDPVQAALRPWDTEDLAGLAVTTTVRTVLDTATWASEAEAARDLARLAGVGADLDAALAQLERRAGWRGAAVARRRIEATTARRGAEGTSTPPGARSATAGPPQAWTSASAALEPVMR